MAFPMYLAAVGWLVWVLGRQAGVDGGRGAARSCCSRWRWPPGGGRTVPRDVASNVT